MEYVYVVISEEEDDKFVSVYSSLEKANIFLENKVGTLGKYTLIKSLVDGLPIKTNNDFKLIFFDNLKNV